MNKVVHFHCEDDSIHFDEKRTNLSLWFVTIGGKDWIWQDKRSSQYGGQIGDDVMIMVIGDDDTYDANYNFWLVSVPQEPPSSGPPATSGQSTLL